MATKYLTYYAPRIKKNGKPGALVELSAPYSSLNCCDVCGLLGGERRVNTKSDVYAWNRDRGDYKTRSKDMLCVSCWNRVRALVKRERAATINKTLINRINMEIRNGRKQREQDGTDHGRPAGLPGELLGRYPAGGNDHVATDQHRTD